jgi:hypothetical protein
LIVDQWFFNISRLKGTSGVCVGCACGHVFVLEWSGIKMQQQ